MCAHTVVYGIPIRRKLCSYQERFLKFLQKMCFPKCLKAEKQRETIGTEGGIHAGVRRFFERNNICDLKNKCSFYFFYCFRLNHYYCL